MPSTFGRKPPACCTMPSAMRMKSFEMPLGSRRRAGRTAGQAAAAVVRPAGLLSWGEAPAGCRCGACEARGSLLHMAAGCTFIPWPWCAFMLLNEVARYMRNQAGTCASRRQPDRSKAEKECTAEVGLVQINGL